MKNGILYGSFNPLHNSHIELIKEGLKYFDLLHIFVRSVPKDDIVSFDTKKIFHISSFFDGTFSVTDSMLLGGI